MRMASLPLVLLPGLLCDARLWRDPAAALADLTPVHHADLTLDDSVAGMAARVLEAAPPVFALAGLSMGGYVAFEILRQAPERVARLAYDGLVQSLAECCVAGEGRNDARGMSFRKVYKKH